MRPKLFSFFFPLFQNQLFNLCMFAAVPKIYEFDLHRNPPPNPFLIHAKF